jgi:hypothetical protein
MNGNGQIIHRRVVPLPDGIDYKAENDRLRQQLADVKEAGNVYIEELRFALRQAVTFLDQVTGHTRGCSYNNAIGDEAEFCTCNRKERREGAERLRKIR